METIAVSKQKNSIQARAEHVGICFLAKGFPYVKVELEANVRPDDYSSESECSICSGSGRIPCGICSSGTTRIRCSTCNGTGIMEAHNDESHPCPDCADGHRETRSKTVQMAILNVRNATAEDTSRINVGMRTIWMPSGRYSLKSLVEL